jgi:DNA-binding NtrC family response regulator
MTREKLQTLLVEPDPAAARLLEGHLAGAPLFEYQVTTVASLAEAEASLRRESWDVVLLDLALPNGAGEELVRRLKELAPDATLLVLAGADDEELAVRALRERAQDCLVRGQLDGPQLLKALRRAIERNRAEIRFRCVQQTLARMDRTVAQLQRLAEPARNAVQATRHPA